MVTKWIWIWILSAFVGVIVALMLSPNCHWPAVARCRVCGKKIWIWQDHLEVPYLTFVDPPKYHLKMKGLVHDGCVKTPVIKIKVIEQRQGSYYFEGLELWPKESIEIKFVAPINKSPLIEV